MVVNCPFLGKTNDCLGKEVADDQADNGTEECYEEVDTVKVIHHKICVIVAHIDAMLGPNHAEEYPRPHEHDSDIEHQGNIFQANAEPPWSSVRRGGAH